MSGGDPARAEIDAALLAWMREPEWKRDDARFETLALALFEHQFAHCAPYRRFCEARGRRPGEIAGWQEIPAVPTGAFKEVALCTFAPERATHVFRTSGTATARRGALYLDTLELYEASLLASFRRHLLPDLAPDERAALRVVAPSTREAADSSLSHMFDCSIEAFGAPGSGHWVRDGALDVARAFSELEALADDVHPPLLCGTAFGFVHLLEALDAEGRRFALPPSTRIMETGGFKGRSRSLPRDELYAWLEDRLGVPAERIVNQYGMCELGSQFYDGQLAAPGRARGKVAPPWTRVRLLEPDGEREVGVGESGRIAIVDLANAGGVAAIETADLGRACDGGFEVLGREAGAEERGCSIAVDLLLGGDTA